METWAVVTLLLCAYGFVKEQRPIDAYLNQYLSGPWVNLTDEQIYNEVYPVWTYSYLCLLLPVLLLTDILLYKPIIVIEALGYFCTYSLALWGNGIQAFKGMEVAYGVATASEVAYYSYIYAQVTKEKFQRVTSYTRSSLLLGRFVSYSMAQILISTGAMNYEELVYISIGGAILCFIVAVALPSVKRSVYFHREEKPEQSSEENLNSESSVEEYVKTSPHGSLQSVEEHKCKDYLSVFKIIWSDLKLTFTNIPVLKWSIWSAMATCGLFQVLNYASSLWEEIAPSDSNSTDVYNGVVMALATLFGATGAFLVQYAGMNWDKYGDIILGVSSAVEVFLLVLMGLTDHIWVAYVAYILSGIIYNSLMTIVSFQVAKSIREETYGLVFGITTFVSLILQTLLTLIVVSDAGFAAPIRTQFFVYAGYFGVIAIIFLSSALYKVLKFRGENNQTL